MGGGEGNKNVGAVLNVAAIYGDLTSPLPMVSVTLAIYDSAPLSISRVKLAPDPAAPPQSHGSARFNGGDISRRARLHLTFITPIEKSKTAVKSLRLHSTVHHTPAMFAGANIAAEKSVLMRGLSCCPNATRLNGTFVT